MMMMMTMAMKMPDDDDDVRPPSMTNNCCIFPAARVINDIVSPRPEPSTNKGIVYHFPLRHQRDVGIKIPQLLPQLQTPEKNVGASPIDALMPASTEGLQ